MPVLFVALVCLALVVPPAAAQAPPSVADAPLRTVDAGQGKIGYRSVGRGRPLVLIMGLAGTMDSWQPSFVNALAGHRRVITFDNEGIRQTTLGPGTLTIRRMGEDVASLIRALRLRRPDVLGWSMGGMIAQSFAGRHPRLLRKLVLCATAPGNGRATFPNPDALSMTYEQVLFAPGHDAAYQAWLRGIGSYPDSSPITSPELRAAQLAAVVTWMAGRDPSGRPLSRIRKPVLVGGGALDPLLPVANQRYLGRALPNARLRIYPDAAHGFLFQYARGFAKRILRFLRPNALPRRTLPRTPRR